MSSKYAPEYAGSARRAHMTYARLRNSYDVHCDVLTSTDINLPSTQYVYEGASVTRIAPLRMLRWFNRISFFQENRFLKKILFLLDYTGFFVRVFLYLLAMHKDYDVFHVFGKNNLTAVGITFAKIVHKPLIVELVNLTDHPFHYEPFFFSLLLGKGFPSDAFIVCISEALKKKCLDVGCRAEKIWCRPNPVDISRFSNVNEVRNDMRSRYNISDEQRVLLYIAKFRPQKNQHFLLEVLKMLPQGYHLFLVGPLEQRGVSGEEDNAYVELIRSDVARLGLTDRVHLVVEFVDRIENYFALSDCLVFPSKKEACGTPVLEALVAGKPVVVHDIPDVFDRWVQNGVNGYRVSLSVAQWCDEILSCEKLDGAQLRELQGFVKKHVAVENIDAQYYSMLKELNR